MRIFIKLEVTAIVQALRYGVILFFIYFCLTYQRLRAKIRILILPISNNYRCNLSIQFPLTAVIVLRLNNLKSVRIRSDTVVPAVKVYLSYELL